MLRIFFEELTVIPEIKFDLYNSINRIPFSLRIGQPILSSESIYARNLSNENFIEFRFDKDNKNLYEITLVSADNNTLEEIKKNEINYQKNKFYSCFIQEENSELEDSIPMKIFRNEMSIWINWDINKQSNVEYFSVSTNCLLGINPDSYLVSVILTNLLQEDIFSIFGV